jgi:hypothetical protein
MKKRLGANGSILGKTAKLVPEKDSLTIYTTSTWIIVLSVWVFAGAFFALTFWTSNFWISVIITALGGALGFYMSFFVYTGKLTTSFSYRAIQSFIRENADFVITFTDQKLYYVRMLPKAQLKLLAQIQAVMQEGDEFRLVLKHGRYVIETTESQLEKVDK